MPGYYSRSMAGQMPLTPPDSGNGYAYSNVHYPQDPYAQPSQRCRQDTSFDYQQGGYLQTAIQPTHPTYQYQPSSYQASTTLPPIQGYYEPIGAPILPPLRINDRVPFVDDYTRRVQQEQQDAAEREQRQAKEEKTTGGVSAKLDYEMERMTDFVTEAAQSMYAFHVSPICLADIDMTRSFQHQMQSQPSFRKWVHQVLSATRLPSATILLALHYLNDRVANYPDSVPQGENQIYRLLAVALILGSKFLDDNTFINRSWSDVTAIKVSELNALEMKWLHLINYELHIEPSTPNGLQAWMDAWQKYNSEYLAKQEYAAKQQAARLSPLNTNVHRHSSIPRDRLSPYPTPSFSSSRSFDTPLSSRSSQFSTPYTASDPWATNEEYYRQQQSYPSFNGLEDIARKVSPGRSSTQAAYQYAPSAHPSYYQTPSYGSAWDQSSWTGSTHRYDCNCSQCLYQHHYRQWPITSGYAAQTVMG
ncbi:uncharacterized protein MYCGRDRAFT_108694 [Zymoseptoria tritici IPO323]|uniref:Cyclin-like protein n=1 Tax=Zymoseptoria tritici (strain CBS 115943 / IPO323) TaxID=336722 RepID=F9X6X6_ZYMTI|nr:uncharacterized protein MYCGRDRAFT_108694 [Zymoseptoria tritici IPO323]EGP88895.1 hypothetical protein MYCGRDRAFT_108694 [Zymoseptoria tritici IPO323]